MASESAVFTPSAFGRHRRVTLHKKPEKHMLYTSVPFDRMYRIQFFIKILKLMPKSFYFLLLANCQTTLVKCIIIVSTFWYIGSAPLCMVLDCHHFNLIVICSSVSCRKFFDTTLSSLRQIVLVDLKNESWYFEGFYLCFARGRTKSADSTALLQPHVAKTIGFLMCLKWTCSQYSTSATSCC